MSEYPVPFWYEEIRNHFRSRNFHQFLIDGNIYEKFFWPSDRDGEVWSDCGEEGTLYTFREFLTRALLRNFEIVFYYSSTSGIAVYRKGVDILFPDSERNDKKINTDYKDILTAEEDVLKRLGVKGIPVASAAIVDRQIENLLKLERVLKTAWSKEQGKEGEKKTVTIATIVDYLDGIITDSPEPSNRHLSERIQKWGLDRRINELGNISILVTENREILPPILHTDTRGTLPVRIPFPDASYRKVFFIREKERGAEDSLLIKYLKSDEDKISSIVQLTRGFRITDCELIKNISEESLLDEEKSLNTFFFGSQNPSSEAIEGFIKEEKKEVIKSQSRGMLDPVESSITFNDIGGLSGVKDYFTRIREAIIKREENPKLVEIVPKGVLLAGPPGTGKTLLAKALAEESGISLVKMGDIRSMWVGESEKNMSLVLSLLKAMAPVIVFIDEVDQAIGSRSTAAGDSGVSRRIFGKVLEFMGDNENRGDVIWIAATNRADLLDDAMIRRFDRVIPVLLPGSEEEWVSVIKGIANQMNVRVNEDHIRDFVKKNIEKLRKNYSGSSVEMALRVAYQKTIESGTGQIGLAQITDAFASFKTNFNQKEELRTVIKRLIKERDDKKENVTKKMKELSERAVSYPPCRPVLDEIATLYEGLHKTKLHNEFTKGCRFIWERLKFIEKATDSAELLLKERERARRM